MTKVLTTLAVLTAVLLSGCQNKAPQQNSREGRPAADPLIAAAQQVIDQDHQGRACTTIARTSYPAAFEGVSGFKKLQLLAKHGVVTQGRKQLPAGEVTAFTLSDLSPSGEQGLFLEVQPVTLYCFGRWTVTSATDTDKVKVDGKRVLLAQVKLSGAVPWVLSDPAAAVLTEATDGLSRDPSFLGALNESDQPVPASLVESNTVLVAVPES